VCAYTNCYYNATYTIGQVQYAITQLEYLIENLSNFDYQVLLKFICGGLTIDFGDIYRICDVANLINSYQIFTTGTGLKTVGLNFVYNIGLFKSAFDAISVCDTNFSDCGFNIGMAYRVLSGYGMPNVTLTTFEEDYNLRNGDVQLFVDGLLDGFDCDHLKSIKAEFSQLLKDAAFVLEGDLTHGQKLVETYGVVKEQLAAIKLPNLTPEDLTALYFKNTEFINSSLEVLDNCEEYECGVTLGKLLALAF